MLLKVTVKENTDFLPMTKVDGEFWQAPKTLHNGESVEVKDFIGFSLMNEYKGCFQVIQHDPIKDAVDNTITAKDVGAESDALKSSRPRRATKDIKAKELTHQEAALKTASEHSELAAERIAAAQAVDEGDKNALNKGPKAGDGHDKAGTGTLDQADQAKLEAKKLELEKEAAEKAAAEKAKADAIKK